MRHFLLRIAVRFRLVRLSDWLINTCDREGGECSKCGATCCPYGDPLHFHHDGCPSCWQDEL
jgi:hypothetical protein